MRHLSGSSTLFWTRFPLVDDELQSRFPVTEHLWLDRSDGVPGDRLRHDDDDSHE